MAPFITILTPLVYIPVLFGLFIGGWGCLAIILREFGLDLEAAVPWINVEGGNIGAPVLLTGVAAFGFIQGAIFRNWKTSTPDDNRTRFGRFGWLERTAVVAMILALVTVPFWLISSLPEN